MTPKERVRLNIYKTLLEEEKRKNKRVSVLSVCLFVVGIVTMSSYNSFMNSISSATTNAYQNFAVSKNTEDELVSSMYEGIYNNKAIELTPDELFIYNTQI